MSWLYEGTGLEFRYQLGQQWIQALCGVSVQIPRQKVVCLVGPSGSGKSTLLNLLGMIENVQGGDLLIDGSNIKTMSETKKNEYRRHKIGFIFQAFHLFPVLRADENVEYFLSRMGLSRKERQIRVDQALDMVGLTQHRHHKPLELSGGQRQRVAIARAIAKRPEVIIADEPTASLDQATGREIMKIFKRSQKESGLTVVVASHDPMVVSFAEQKIYLSDGKVQEREKHVSDQAGVAKSVSQSP